MAEIHRHPEHERDHGVGFKGSPGYYVADTWHDDVVWFSAGHTTGRRRFPTVPSSVPGDVALDGARPEEGSLRHAVACTCTCRCACERAEPVAEGLLPATGSRYERW